MIQIVRLTTSQVRRGRRGRDAGLLLCALLGTLGTAVSAPPVITQGPVDSAVKPGEPLRLTVTATGTPLTYQWQKDGTDIPGATNATFLRVRPSANNAGGYTVVVSSGDGSITSAPPAVVTVSPAPPPLSGGCYDSTFKYPVPVEAQSHVVGVAQGGYSVSTWVSRDLRAALLDNGLIHIWGSETYSDAPGSINAHYLTRPYFQTGSGNINLLQGGLDPAWSYEGNQFVSMDGMAVGTSGPSDNGPLVALRNDGAVFNMQNASNPRQIPTPRPAIAIAAGPGKESWLPGFVVTLQDDHSMFVWKYADGSATNKNGVALPIPTGLQSRVKSIAADTNGFAGLREDGSLMYQPLDGSASITIPSQEGIKLLWGTPSFALTEDHRGQTWDGNAWQLAAVPHWTQGHLLSRPGPSLIVSSGIPWIVEVPKDATFNAGETARFEVDGGGAGVTYQWYQDGRSVAGATNAVLSLPEASALHQGAYTVVLSNSFGSITSAPPAELIMTTASVEGFELVSLDPTVDLPLSMRRGVKQLSVGDEHIVTLGRDGVVRGWIRAGSHIDYGQATVPPAARSGVVDVSTGVFNSVAIKADGSAVFWGGADQYPRLLQSPPGNIRKAPRGEYFLNGDGTISYLINADGGVVKWDLSRNVFVTNGIPPAASSGVIQVDAGNALKADGTVISLTGATLPAGVRSGMAMLGLSGYAGEFASGLKQDGSIVTWNPYTGAFGISSNKFPGAIGLAGEGPTVVTAEGNAVRLDPVSGLNTAFVPAEWQGKVVQFSRGFALLKQSPGLLRFTTPLPSQLLSTNIPLSAYSLRGLPVRIRVVSGPATNSGTILYPTGIGLVTVVAEEVNASNPADAESITRTFTIPIAHQVLTISGMLPISLSLARPTLDLTVVASSGLPVSYSVGNGPAFLTGNRLTVTNLGRVAVIAEQRGDASMAPAPPLTLFFVVRNDQHLVTSGTIPDATYGGPSPIELQVTADSGLPVRYTVLSGPGVIIAKKYLAIVGVGAIQVAADQDGNDLFNPAPSRTLTFITRPPLQWKPRSQGGGTPTLLTRLPLKQTSALMEGTLGGFWKPFAAVTGLGPDTDIEVPLAPTDLSAPAHLWRVDVTP